MRKLFNLIFVTKPVGFILFLCAGVGAFLIVSAAVRVPFFQTVDATLCREGNEVVLEIADSSVLTGEPVYVYEYREDHLEKVVDYEAGQNKVVLGEDIPEWRSGSKLKMDVQVGEKSLLEIIFQNGGNI